MLEKVNQVLTEHVAHLRKVYMEMNKICRELNSLILIASRNIRYAA